MSNYKRIIVLALIAAGMSVAVLSCGGAGSSQSVDSDKDRTSEISEVSSEVNETLTVTEQATKKSESARVTVSQTKQQVTGSETSSAQTQDQYHGNSDHTQNSENNSTSSDDTQNNANNDSSSQENEGGSSEELPEDPLSAVNITLNGDSAECSSDKVAINGSSVTVKTDGTFRLSGKYNGQIIVNAPKEAIVVLELDNVNISNSGGHAVYVESAGKVKISSCSGTTNILADGGSSSACIYSKDDLTLKGEGIIEIYGNVKNAVNSKNNLKVTGGTLKVWAANNALVGKDKVVVEAGNIEITGCKDGIKATNETEAGKGVVIITGGNINITGEDDAIQAISSVSISGCTIKTQVGGKKVNCDLEKSVSDGCIE